MITCLALFSGSLKASVCKRVGELDVSHVAQCTRQALKSGGTAPVKGGGAAAELVQDDEGVGSGMLQDGGGLRALHQEGALARQDAVLGACMVWLPCKMTPWHTSLCKAILYTWYANSYRRSAQTSR